MRLSHDSFPQYKLDYPYFELAVDQRDYTLLTEADLQHCAAGSITICPAEAPVYHAQLMTCEGSLYFQSPDSLHLCRKDLLRHYRTPTLIHHGSKWAYHFPDPRQVTIRCRRSMDSPHALCRSWDADYYTRRPPVTRPLRRCGRYPS